MPSAVAIAIPKRHGWGGGKLRQLEHFGAGQTRLALPPARGALVPQADSAMRWSALGLTMLVFGLGFGAGWLVKGRRGG